MKTKRQSLRRAIKRHNVIVIPDLTTGISFVAVVRGGKRKFKRNFKNISKSDIRFRYDKIKFSLNEMEGNLQFMLGPVKPWIIVTNNEGNKSFKKD